MRLTTGFRHGLPGRLVGLWWLGLALIGCGGDVSEPQGQRDAGCDADATYSDFVHPLIAEHCLPCHSESLQGAARLGAPTGVDFDDEAKVQDQASRIHLRAVELRNMPPAGGLGECDLTRLGSYLEGVGAEGCIPACDGRSCGDDGCAGTCGTCTGNQRCDDGSGQCVDAECAPQCAGIACGDDGCGGSCGSCGPGLGCDAGRCICLPQCAARTCGDDGCGGQCGVCQSPEVCGLGDSCVCIPDCGGKICGDDGCGGSCGSCVPGETCTAPDSCQCVPDCSGRQCGDDGCGGSCGSCPGIRVCNTRTGTCALSCSADCAGRSCGDDGCGGSCGPSCQAGEYCDAAGSCQCTPQCQGLACGGDGCGGSCGTCAAGTVCNAGKCACTADCSGRSCGGDGCGGSCGSCPAGEVCAGGGCAEQCVPSCDGLQCGDDGCGGSCGACAGGAACDAGACQYPQYGFGADVYPILKASGCGTAACHGGVRPAEALDLSSEASAYDDLVGVAASECGARQRVEPGAPDASYLVNKVTGVDMCSGSRMPKTGAALTRDEVDLLRAWIGAGALP